MGFEGSGVVTGTGPGVTGIRVGDRVMGLLPGGVGPVAVTDRRLVSRYPASWTFAQAAAVPVAYLTAWFLLWDGYGNLGPAIQGVRPATPGSLP